jgi:glycosyltransferase involved in cell wall biosynthesis
MTRRDDTLFEGRSFQDRRMGMTAGDGLFRALVMSSGFEPGFRGGGPVRSVCHVVDTAARDVAVTLVTADRDVGCRQPYPGLSGTWVDRGRARVFYLPIRRPSRWLRLLRELHTQDYDVLYLNSFWSPSFSILPVVARRLGLIRARTVLLAPRGELSAGALGLKTRKKLAFLRWWHPFLRNTDILWHASTESEADEIRTLFPEARIMVILNGLTLSAEPLAVPPETEGPARFVFISRISPKKNLDLALRALQNVADPVALDIYGPIEDVQYWSRCQRLIEHLPSHVRVNYMGELTGDRVRATFARYDAFLFPTRGENFGHVIAESLSASCPVVCSDRTPWTAVLAGGGGAVVRPLTATALGVEIERIATRTPAQRLVSRRAAGEVYRSWRATTDDRNVLDQLRVASAERAGSWTAATAPRHTGPVDAARPG